MTDPANDLVVSAATVWEISIKVGLRKLTLSSPYRDWMNDVVTDFDLELLPVTIDHSAA